MTSSFWKQFYEVSWREEMERILVPTVLSLRKKKRCVISPFVTLQSEITELLPEGISTSAET